MNQLIPGVTDPSIEKFKRKLLDAGLSQQTIETITAQLIDATTKMVVVKVIGDLGQVSYDEISAIQDDAEREQRMETEYFQKTGKTVDRVFDELLQTYVDNFEKM